MDGEKNMMAKCSNSSLIWRGIQGRGGSTLRNHKATITTPIREKSFRDMPPKSKRYPWGFFFTSLVEDHKQDGKAATTNRSIPPLLYTP